MCCCGCFAKNIVAFKDATADPPAAVALIARAGDHFDLYSGDDAYALPLRAAGAVGVVGTSTHWTGPQFQRMIAAFERGDVALARAINVSLIESYEFINNDECVFSMSIKAMLRTLGQDVGDCRLPLPPAPPLTEQRACEVWEALGA